MGKRKELVANPMKLAALLTKIEGGKSEIKVGDMRQAIKIIIDLEATLRVAGYKSILVMLRKQAQIKAEKAKKKMKKKK